MAIFSAHKCSVLGCTDQHKSLHVLPKEEDVSNKWKEFVNEDPIVSVISPTYVGRQWGEKDQRTVGLMTHQNNANMQHT